MLAIGPVDRQMGMDTADTIRRAAFRFEADLDGFGSLFDFIDEADAMLIGEANARHRRVLPFSR